MWVFEGILISIEPYIPTKQCENTKNYNYSYVHPGSNKVVKEACEQESEEKIQNFDF